MWEMEAMKCRPPRRSNPLRLKPSLAFRWECPGCGYYFRTEAQMVDHQKAYQRLEEAITA